MAQQSTRQSPLVRRTKHYPLSMVEHGSLILELLVSVRFATGNQIQRVIFDAVSTSERMARHRATRSLRRLFDAGLVRRVSVFAPSSTGRMSQQIVHTLSPAGARAVGIDSGWVRCRSPKPQAVLVHDAWLMELAVRAMADCPSALSILTWWDDRILAARKRQGLLSLPTIPDGYLLVEHAESGKRYPSLVELDLGSESVQGSPGRRDVAQKLRG